MIIINIDNAKMVNKYASFYKHRKDCNCAVCKNVRGEGGGFHLSEKHKRKIGKANKGKKRTDQQKKNISDSCQGRIAWNKGILNSTATYWLGKSNKDIIVTHHIDGNHKNNIKNNFLEIPQGIHRSLHWRGYEYLVCLGKVRDYLRKFMIKYDINPLIDDGKIIHHIDCNRENNLKDNLMYISDKSLHNKLHQEAYLYIIKINKIKDYFDWFFLRREEITKKS